MVRSSKSGIKLPAENCLRLASAMLLAWTTAGYPALAQTPPPPSPEQQVSPPPPEQQAPPSPQPSEPSPPSQQAPPANQDVQTYSMSDLEYILGPIALFPDPLLALIFPASNFPDQLAEAKQWIDSNPQAIANNDFSAVDSKPWDPTVQALTRFPDVIDMLTEHPDWTESVAWAFSVQHEDVSAAIQLLRAKAKSAGNLQSTPQQMVTTQDDNGSSVIYIAPADPERIYVPMYDPGVVFDGALAGAVLFSTAVIVGSAWNNRWGWHNRNWNQVWVHPPGGWRPVPGRPGGRPVWRPDYRPDWRPNRPGVRPERPGGMRPGGPGFRPDRPDIRPPGGRPGGRPALPSTRPDRPNFRPDRPGGIGDRPGAGRPGRPDFQPGGGRPGARPDNRPSLGGMQRPGGPGAARPGFQSPANRLQSRPPQRPQAGYQPRPQGRPQQPRPQMRPQIRPQQPRPQARPPQARPPQARPPQARPQSRPQARPQGRPPAPRPQGGGGGRQRPQQ